MGDEGGNYLAVREDGVAASFEARGLPIDSLELDYHAYELTGSMPEGWTVEISQVAPAFGREGGSLQVLIFDSVGRKVSVDQLERAGVLR
ncbi:TNT domain-containing protein [Mycolicibacterium tokaiense]|uniref:TNT domain-containing protein n=1 Tax=Mycolicibacterium tokaiense TaxID=39695 RepID=UPI00338EEEEA